MVEIRNMKLQDIEEVHAYGTAERRFAVSGSTQVFWTPEQLRDWLVAGQDVLLVAEHEERVVGYALSQYHGPTGKATFENLYVVPEQRKTGLGKQLTQALIVQLKERGAKYICALVEPDNAGIIRTLQSQGFQKGKNYVWMDLS